MMTSIYGQIQDAVRRGMNPNQIAMRLAQRNPAVQQAMRFMNGKSPQQIQREAQQMAAQRGVDLNQLAQKMGMQLPKMI